MLELESADEFDVWSAWGVVLPERPGSPVDLELCVSGPGGHICTIRPGVASSLRELTAAIERDSGIPALGQRLFSGTRELIDGAPLCEQIPHGAHREDLLLVRRTPAQTRLQESERTKQQNLRAADIELEEESPWYRPFAKAIIKSTGQRIAMRRVKANNKASRDQLLSSIRGLVSGKACPNILDYYAGFVSKNVVHIAMEYMDLGSLRELQKRATNKQVHPSYLPQITTQIMLGLQFLHTELNVHHGNIKPGSILHSTVGQVKLRGVGIAEDLNPTLALAQKCRGIGLETYMSPERCLGIETNLKDDIWSVGMIIHELATGRYAFSDCTSFPDLFEHLCEKPEPRMDPRLFPQELADFVGHCLTRDGARRPNAEWLLAQPWLNQDVPSVEDLAVYFGTLDGV